MKKIKITALIIGTFSVLYFISITVQRFQEDEQSSERYYQNIPSKSPIQDPVLYSYLDYNSQWIFNGFEILQRYDGIGFNGHITFQPLFSLLGSFGIIEYSYEKYYEKRTKLWTNHYSYSFNGYPAYTVYDYGIYVSIVFSLFFILIVNKMRPKNKTIKLRNLFLITLLVQIPSLSIFYSQIGGIIIAFCLWIPIYFYVRFRI